MSSNHPEQLQNLIEAVRKGRLKDELSDEDVTRLYSRLFTRCEEAGGTTLEDMDCHDFAHIRGIMQIRSDTSYSIPSNVEDKKDELGGKLKNKFKIDNLTDINRWVASCVDGYITVLPGDKILSRMYCPVCHKRSWIDPHPDEVSKQKIDKRTLKRLNRSRTFLQ